MLNIPGLLGRIVNALLYGLVVFIIVYILGIVVGHFDAQVGSFLERFAAALGVLAGLAVFFGAARPTV